VLVVYRLGRHLNPLTEVGILVETTTGVLRAREPHS
jgi:hypothetical protein